MTVINVTKCDAYKVLTTLGETEMGTGAFFLGEEVRAGESEDIEVLVEVVMGTGEVVTKDGVLIFVGLRSDVDLSLVGVVIVVDSGDRVEVFTLILGGTGSEPRRKYMVDVTVTPLAAIIWS